MKLAGRTLRLGATLALALPCACAAPGPASSPPPPALAVDDAGITARVLAAIEAEPALKTARITVQTFKGRVQLEGNVSSLQQIETAMKVASNVNGVSGVTNGLERKSP